MEKTALVQQRVQAYFIEGDNNCAMTALKLLSEVFEVPLEPQVIDAAGCLPGAGGVGGLCGLISGVLMFIGVWGSFHGLHRKVLTPMTQGFTEGVRERFGDITCQVLKPSENGCGDLAAAVLTFAIDYVDREMARFF